MYLDSISLEVVLCWKTVLERRPRPLCFSMPVLAKYIDKCLNKCLTKSVFNRLKSHQLWRKRKPQCLVIKWYFLRRSRYGNHGEDEVEMPDGRCLRVFKAVDRSQIRFGLNDHGAYMYIELWAVFQMRQILRPYDMPVHTWRPCTAAELWIVFRGPSVQISYQLCELKKSLRFFLWNMKTQSWLTLQVVVKIRQSLLSKGGALHSLHGAPWSETLLSEPGGVSVSTPQRPGQAVACQGIPASCAWLSLFLPIIYFNLEIWSWRTEAPHSAQILSETPSSSNILVVFNYKSPFFSFFNSPSKKPVK